MQAGLKTAVGVPLNLAKKTNTLWLRFSACLNLQNAATSTASQTFRWQLVALRQQCMELATMLTSTWLTLRTTHSRVRWRGRQGRGGVGCQDEGEDPQSP